MGLIKAALGSAGGVFADQWREYFYCDSMDADVLMTKGIKRTSSRSSNKKSSDNIISNGAVIAVNEGQCMMIVEQGQIVEFSAEAGEFTWDSSTEGSVLYGGFGEGLKTSWNNLKRRFTFGADTGKDQRIYFINTKEIMGNKYGTPAPVPFRVVDKNIGLDMDVSIRCNGEYSYKITDPMLFYKNVCGNIDGDYTRDRLDSQLKSEFITALQPAFAELTELELRPAQIPAHTKELKVAINHAMQTEWTERRGITVQSIALGPIALSPEDMKKISEMEDDVTMGSNPFMMAGRMTTATANAMETAAGNTAGAMTGFMGMGMAGGAMGGGFNTAQSFYNMGMQQMQQQQVKLQL